jgi:quinol monooxygenase YgiN
MSKLSYLVELSIKDGQLEAFKEKAAGFTAAVQEKEPETLAYRWHLAEDGKRGML